MSCHDGHPSLPSDRHLPAQPGDVVSGQPHLVLIKFPCLEGDDRRAELRMERHLHPPVSFRKLPVCMHGVDIEAGISL